LLDEYDRYLQKERSLALATRRCYVPFVRQFLKAQFKGRRISLAVLRTVHIVTHVQRQAPLLKGAHQAVVWVISGLF
jgi:hypothetical protein